MYRNLIACLFAAAAIALLAPPVLADEYKVRFDTGRPAYSDGAEETRTEHRIANIEATLTPDKGRIGLYRAHDDSGLTHGWATFVHNLAASDKSGSDLSLTYVGKGAWEVEGWRRGPVTVRYQMLLHHDRFPNEPGDDELAYARPYGVMWTGRALFMEGADTDNINIEFDLPEGWRVTAPWRHVEGDPSRFIAKDENDLLDSAFMAGTHKEVILPVAGAEARIALGQGVGEAETIIASSLDTFLSAYEKLLGAGISDNFLVVAAEANFWGAGVMGRSISVSAGGPLEGPFVGLTTYIMAHEGFHLWQADDRHRISQRNGELEWMKEGLAEYYTFITGVREGVFPEEFLLEQLGERASLYRNALNSRTIKDAGATKLSGGADSYNLIYSGGMMVIAALDAIIRAESNGEQTFDDALREIEQRYGPTGSERMTLVGLDRMLRKYGVKRGFLNRALGTQNPMDLTDLFSVYGLDVATEETGDGVSVSVTRSENASEAQTEAWQSLLQKSAE